MNKAMFQSAPGGGAGGNGPRLIALAETGSFNPPPAVGPGETSVEIGYPHHLSVSIRPRRWGRGKLGGSRNNRRLMPVSIRPRRWGRGKLVPFVHLRH